VLANRIAQVGVSATMSIAATAKRMAADGIDVIDLSIGEPDFPTPENVCAAAVRAIRDGHHHYTPNPGTMGLRTAVSQKLMRDHGLEIEPTGVIVSAGAKQSLYNALAALVEPGDKVLIPTPYWVSYPAMVRLVGGEPVLVATRENRGFQLGVDDLEPHLRDAKILLLNSPNNPTGAVIDPDSLREVAVKAAEAGLFILSDEIYEHLVYDDAQYRCVATLDPALQSRTLTVNGVSKAYAMTGWRVGYAAGPKWLIDAMGVVQSHSTSGANSIAQAAAEEALNGPQGEVEKMRVTFEERRQVIFDGLGTVRGWSASPTAGAFYAFPNVSASIGGRVGDRVFGSSLELADYLLKVAKVAIVPGEAFGAPGYMRFSYAAATDRIEEATRRVREAIGALS
jgi:aspartate aminotransferase